MSKRLLNVFNGGETTALLAARFDNERAQTGVAEMTNMIPKVHGAAVHRPPMEYLVTLASTASTSVSRCFGFAFNTAQKFTIEISVFSALVPGTVGYAVRNQQGQSLDGAQIPWLLPITNQALRLVSFFQDRDVIYLLHPDNPPLRIVRHSDTKWMWELFWPKWPAIGNEIDEWQVAQETIEDAGVTASYGLGAALTTPWVSNALDPFRMELVATGDATLGWTGTIKVQHRVAAHTKIDGTTVADGAAVEYLGAGVEVTNLTAGQIKTLDCNYDALSTLNLALKILTPGFYEEIIPAPVQWRLVITRTAGTGTVAINLRANTKVGRLESTTVDTSPVQATTLSGIGSGYLPGSYCIMRGAGIFSNGDFLPTTVQGTEGSAITPTRLGAGQGERWRVSHFRDGARISLAISTTGQSSSLRVGDKVLVTTVGSWYGTLYLEAQDPILTTDWEVISQWSGSANRNISEELDVGETGNLRLRFVTSPGTPSGTPTAYAEPATSRGHGVLERMPAFAVDGAIINSRDWAIMRVHEAPLFTKPTRLFQKEAWNRGWGFPTVVLKHEQRVWFGGSYKFPNMLWGAEVNEPLNLSFGSLDASPITIQIDSSNPIVWAKSASRGIVVGTRGEEWLVNSGEEKRVMTPSTVLARVQSYHGGNGVAVAAGDEAVFFAQRGGLILRRHAYTFERDSYTAENLSVFAEHLGQEGSIVMAAYTTNPEGMLWALLDNGRLYALAYDASQQVVAWWRIVTDGTVEGIHTLIGDDGKADAVFMVVVRGTARTLEVLNTNWWNDLGRETVAAMCYADCRVTHVASSAVTSIPVPAALNGKLLWITKDGVPQPPATAASGAVAVPSGSGTFRAGLPYTAQLTLHRMEEQLAAGSAQGAHWRISAVGVDVWNSHEAEVRAGPDWEPMALQTWDQWPAEETGTLKSGIVEKRVEAPHALATRLQIRSTGPLPLNLRALFPTYETYGV